VKAGNSVSMKAVLLEQKLVVMLDNSLD
jgi:hypothetical protein